MKMKVEEATVVNVVLRSRFVCQEPQEKIFVKFDEDLLGILRSTVQDCPNITVILRVELNLGRSSAAHGSYPLLTAPHRSSSTDHSKWARSRGAELRPLPQVEVGLQLDPVSKPGRARSKWWTQGQTRFEGLPHPKRSLGPRFF